MNGCSDRWKKREGRIYFKKPSEIQPSLSERKSVATVTIFE